MDQKDPKLVEPNAGFEKHPTMDDVFSGLGISFAFPNTCPVDAISFIFIDRCIQPDLVACVDIYMCVFCSNMTPICFETNYFHYKLPPKCVHVLYHSFHVRLHCKKQISLRDIFSQLLFKKKKSLSSLLNSYVVARESISKQI